MNPAEQITIAETEWRLGVKSLVGCKGSVAEKLMYINNNPGWATKDV